MKVKIEMKNGMTSAVVGDRMRFVFGWGAPDRMPEWFRVMDKRLSASDWRMSLT